MMPHVLGIKKARENNKSVKKPIGDEGSKELITGRKNMEERSVNTDLSGPNQQNAIVQTVAIDYEPTRIEISDNNQLNSNNKASTQAPANKQQKRGIVKAHEDFLNENLFFGGYQPPALFFNSELDGRQNTVNPSNIDSKQRMVNEMNNKKSYLNFRMEYLSVAVRNQEFIEG